MKISYKKVKGIENISRFDVSNNNDVAFIRDERAFILDNKFDKIDIDLSFKSLLVFFIENDFYVADLDDMGTRVYYEGYLKNVLLDSLLAFSLSLENRMTKKYFYPVVTKKARKDRFNARFDFKNFKLSDEFDLYVGYNGVFSILNDNLFLSIKGAKLGVFTYDNECIWEKHTKDFYQGESEKEIEIPYSGILHTKERLYIPLDKTYALDIYTGELVDVYPKCFSVKDNECLYGLSFVYHKQTQTTHLSILNTKTNHFEYINVNDEFKDRGISPDWINVVDNGLLYFTQTSGTHHQKIGVFDLKTRKVLWHHEFDENTAGIRNMKVNKNRIYVQTTDLLIFEREE